MGYGEDLGPLFGPGPHRSAWRTSPEVGRAAEGAGMDTGMDTGRVALLPTGAVEQHGPHLPLGVDAWLAEAVCLGVSRSLSASGPGAAPLVAERLSYGCSWHHTRFPGTVTLRTRTFVDLVVDVCRSLAAGGYRPLVVNGHGGNRGALQVALAEAAEAGVRAWTVSYFELLPDVAEQLFPPGETATGHACALETSLVWYLWPEAVRVAAIPAGETPATSPDPHLYSQDPLGVVRPFDEINPTGVIGRPSAATPEAGARLYRAAVDRLADVVRRVAAARPTA